jgi:hypothetical protein
VITLNGYQIKRLLDFVDSDDESEVTIDYIDHERPDANSSDGEMMPAGYYAWFPNCPDEGALLLPLDAKASASPPLTPVCGSPYCCLSAGHEGACDDLPF